MLIVLGLRISGLIDHSDAIVDLVVLLVIGVLSPMLTVWLSRRG